MIESIKKPNTDEEIFEILHPIVKEWFRGKFGTFCLPQKYGIMKIHSRMNTLISAPTGSGKTLTAFLSILNELIDSSEKKILEDKIYCVYISPLKALNYDLEHNLLEPLKEMEKIAGHKLGIRVAVRTGDTSAYEKSKMLKNPPHILITTPESLGIVLSASKFINHLKNVEWVIVDEVHALAENKRGVHLSLSLERLQRLSRHITRIGLSATIAPIKEVAQYLVGMENGKYRSCKVVDVLFIKKTDLKVLCPVPNLIDTSHAEMHEAMYSLIDDLIQKHRTTLIFTNTRSATERVVNHLKEKFPRNYTENIGAHHGSLSKTLRRNIENRLRQGNLRAVVCLEGNTKVLDDKGEWKPIKKLDCLNSVQSIDDKLRINENKVLNRFKSKNKDKLLKLKTNLGKEIVCTKDHKFLTINEKGQLVWKECINLNEGDFVATLRKNNYNILKGEELKKFTFKNYPENYFVSLNLPFLKKIKLSIKNEFSYLKNFWKKYLSKDYSYSSFRSNLDGRFLFKIKHLNKILTLLKINEVDVFNEIMKVSSSKYKMPKIEIKENLMRLLGFMLADGYVSNKTLFVSNRDKKLLNYYGKIIKKNSGKRAGFKLSSSGTPVLMWQSRFLSEFLRNTGFKLGRKARIVNIPSFVFRLNSDMIFCFLSGYFDGDGYLEVKEKGRVYSAGFSTSSKEMAQDISRLLLREGITSSIRSSYYDELQELNGRIIVKKGWIYNVVILGGENLRKFAMKITPIRENLKEIKSVLNLRGYTNLDVIPNIGKRLREIRTNTGLSTYKLQKKGINPIKYELGTRNIGRNQLKKLLSIYKYNDGFLKNLLTSDLFWERIKSKEIIKSPKFVYNIEVSKDHNYIANGFLTKNCSTSLELGIDIGYIDLVILLGSPKSVARAIQRIGRSGHRLSDISKGRIIVLNRDDMVECAVLLKSAIEKKIDRIHIPKNCLDVLAQQVLGIAISEKIHIKELFELIKKSYCFKNLKYKDFKEVIDYLSGKHISLEDRHVYAKIWYDEESGMIGRKGRMTRVIYMTNIGTIPDETFITVKIGNQTIGKLDEAFLERLHRGDVFVLGGEKYEFLYSKGMVAYVNASVYRPPTIPSWFSEMLPLSFDLANDISHFRYLMEEKLRLKKPKKEIIDFINNYLYVDKNTANSIYEYFREQFLYASVPSEKKVVVETYVQEDKKYVIFHTLFGRRVNDALSRALAYIVSRSEHHDVEVGVNDNGFYLASQKRMDVKKALKLLKSEKLDLLLNMAIEHTEVLKRRFRHCATRALMILRSYKGRQKRVGRQQVSSMILMNAVKRISKDFPILKEARREVLEDLMDIKNAKLVLKMIENKKIKIIHINTSIPSPFAFNLVLQGYMDLLKMDDKIEFLRRMHQMVLAKIALKS